MIENKIKNVNAKIRIVDYPRISTGLVALFCLYIVLWYLQIGYRSSLLGSIRFELLFAIFLLCMAFFCADRQDLSSPLYTYAMLFLGCILFQIPFSQDFETSLTVFMDRVVKFAFISVLIVLLIRSPLHLKFFVVAFLLACFRLSQEGFVGSITGGLVWENQGIMRLHGPTPMYEHPNSFAGNALGVIPFVVFLFPILGSVLKLSLVVQGLLSLYVVLRTGSRTAYVAFLVFLLYVLGTTKKKIKILLILIVLAVIMIPLIPGQYIERFESIFTLKEKEGRSSETRIEIIKDSWEVFKEYPFGVGVGAFPAVRKKMFGRTQDTHNLYFEIVTNLGVEGLVVFIFFICNIMRALAGLQKNLAIQINSLDRAISHVSHGNTHLPMFDVSGHLFDLKFMQAVSKAVFFFLIIRLALGLFGMDLYEIYWWFALGLTIALCNMNKISERKTEAILENSREHLPEHELKSKSQGRVLDH